MWERLKYTKRFDWVDQSKVISLFFHLYIFDISKVNIDQSKVDTTFDH